MVRQTESEVRVCKDWRSFLMGYVAVPVDQEIKREFGFSVLLSNSWPSLTKLITGFAFTGHFRCFTG